MDTLPDGVHSVITHNDKTYYKMPLIRDGDKCQHCSFALLSVGFCEMIKQTYYPNNKDHAVLPCISYKKDHDERKDYVFVGKSRYKKYLIKLIASRLEGTT